MLTHQKAAKTKDSCDSAFFSASLAIDLIAGGSWRYSSGVPLTVAQGAPLMHLAEMFLNAVTGASRNMPFSMRPLARTSDGWTLKVRASALMVLLKLNRALNTKVFNS